MSRIARNNIRTPFMHVMVQGVNKEFIFGKEKYLKFYLKNALENLDNSSFELIAYCMMNNHAHFLFYVSQLEKFEQYMKKNNQKFALYYNKNENRVGVVFRNRYQVEPIYDSSYLKNCIKYIHDNPVKAKMVENSKDYLYSSYNDYLTKQGVSQSKALSLIFGEDEDYLTIIEDSTDMRFIDFEKEENCKKYILSALSEFVKKYNCRLVDILENKETIRRIIVYLKNRFNIQYSESIRYFKVSRRIIKDIKDSES